MCKSLDTKKLRRFFYLAVLTFVFASILSPCFFGKTRQGYVPLSGGRYQISESNELIMDSNRGQEQAIQKISFPQSLAIKISSQIPFLIKHQTCIAVVNFIDKNSKDSFLPNGPISLKVEVESEEILIPAFGQTNDSWHCFVNPVLPIALVENLFWKDDIDNVFSTYCKDQTSPCDVEGKTEIHWKIELLNKSSSLIAIYLISYALSATFLTTISKRAYKYIQNGHNA